MKITRIPIQAQIRGIQKALNNPKTPVQFRTGLMKRLNHLSGELKE